MATIRQRHDPVRLFGRRLVLFALFMLVIFGIWSVWGAWHKEEESAELKQESQAALSDLATQQTQLKGEIVKLESDRGREEALRDQYNMGKQGEDLIIIVDPATTTPIESTSTILDRIEQAFSWW